MRTSIFAIFAVIIMGSLLPESSYAANWPNLPPACLPERAGTPGLSGCECPPSNLCPATYEEYSNPATYKMPVALVTNPRCCPVLEPQYCPAGTAFAGQRVPADGHCNPTCPVGTELAGQEMPANGQCCVTNCPACPAKYYPSFADSATSGGADGYTYQNGQRYNFVNQGDADMFGDSRRLSGRYGFSLRVEGLQEWVFGPKYCTYWDPSGNNCYVTNGFVPLSGGANTGFQSLSSLYSSMGANNLVWFGYSVVNRDILAPNFASPAVVAAMANNDRMQLAAHSVFSGHQNYTLDPAIENGAPDFLRQCRMVGGEYIELEHKDFSGNQCPYLQCRYVYGDPGMESCFAEDVAITLADGKTKTVKDIALGDVLKGSDGNHKVTALNRYQSGLRVLYGVNNGGAMLTGDHPIKTTEGWKVINKDVVKFHAKTPGFAKTPLAVGDTIVTEKGEVKVTSIDRFPNVDPISTFNLKVDGNGEFFANGIEVKGFNKMEMHYE